MGPFLFFLFLFMEPPVGLSKEALGVLATLWVASWWITEAVPIPVTSLLPTCTFYLQILLKDKYQ
jgi:solute carrier family 13 (sodium-dependent dicarboxylate transporter), member 2/3/5